MIEPQVQAPVLKMIVLLAEQDYKTLKLKQ